MTPLVADATKAMLEAGVRDVRNQGVLMHGVNAAPTELLDLCFALLDGAGIMPYYFYMCDMIPFSEHWRVSVREAQHLQHGIMGYLPGFATPRIICDVPFVGKRWVHQLEEYDRERGISYWTKNYRTGIELDRPRGAEPPLRVLRPDRHAARGRSGVVAEHAATHGDGHEEALLAAAAARAAAEARLAGTERSLGRPSGSSGVRARVGGPRRAWTAPRSCGCARWRPPGSRPAGSPGRRASAPGP